MKDSDDASAGKSDTESSGAREASAVLVQICKHCGLPLPTDAKLCAKCGHWQNWRSHIGFSVPVLSLLLAIVTVVFSSGREFYEYVSEKPKVDLYFLTMSFSKNPEQGEIPAAQPDDASILLVNSEERFVTVKTVLKCAISNVKAPKDVVQATMVLSGQGASVFAPGDFYAVPEKSQQLLKYSDVAFEGADMDKIVSHDPKDGNVAEVRIECPFMYFFEGERHEQMVQLTLLVDQPQ
jgi:ribosomal protein L40E